MTEQETTPHFAKSQIYHFQGGVISNFAEFLSSEQSLLAQEIAKASYDYNNICYER